MWWGLMPLSPVINALQTSYSILGMTTVLQLMPEEDEPASVVVMPRTVGSDRFCFAQPQHLPVLLRGRTWQAAPPVTVCICQHQGELCFPSRYWLSFSPVFNQQLPPNNPEKSCASCHCYSQQKEELMKEHIVVSKYTIESNGKICQTARRQLSKFYWARPHLPCNNFISPCELRSTSANTWAGYRLSHVGFRCFSSPAQTRCFFLMPLQVTYGLPRKSSRVCRPYS